MDAASDNRRRKVAVRGAVGVDDNKGVVVRQGLSGTARVPMTSQTWAVLIGSLHGGDAGRTISEESPTVEPLYLA